jgi:hypothetical protein
MTCSEGKAVGTRDDSLRPSRESVEYFNLATRLCRLAYHPLSDAEGSWPEPGTNNEAKAVIA